jgi:hypothetical protein
MRTATTVTLLLVGPACGAGEPPVATTAAAGGSAGAASGGSGGSDGGKAGAIATECDSPAFELQGVVLDGTRGCIDATRLVAVGCIAKGAQFPARPAFQCFEENGTGARYWAHVPDAIVAFPAFTPCSEPQTDLPHPLCEFLACAGSDGPRSLCTHADTVVHLPCGGDASDRDDACCLRRSCETSADCREGEQCKDLSVLNGRYCWQLHPGACSCAGQLGGPRLRLCVTM